MVGYSPDFCLFCGCLMASGVGMAGHFLTLQWNKHFKKNKDVLDKSCPQYLATSGRFAAPVGHQHLWCGFYSWDRTRTVVLSLPAGTRIRLSSCAGDLGDVVLPVSARFVWHTPPELPAKHSHPVEKNSFVFHADRVDTDVEILIFVFRRNQICFGV